MAMIDITDEAGNPVRITSIDEMKAFINRIEVRRDMLAERMLSTDLADARQAEAMSDQLEDVYIPRLMDWVKAFNLKLEDEAGDNHRREKANAIKTRRS